MLSGGFDSRIILRDSQSKSARQVLKFHDGNVTKVVLLPDGRFATAGQDGRVALWDIGEQSPRFATDRGVSPVSALAVAPDGARLAVGFWDGNLAIIDTATGALRVEQAHEGRLSGLAFLASGDVATVGADLRFARWSPDLTVRANTGLPDLPNGMERSGDRLVVIFATGLLGLYSEDGEPLPERFLSERPLVALAASPGTIAAAAVDGSIWLLEAERLRLRAGIEGGQGPVWALALAEGTLYVGGASGAIRQHSAIDGALLSQGGGLAADDFDDGSRGAEVWRACAVCHSLEPGDHSRAGPSLNGIFGRPIASVEGFAFSPALRELDIVWTPRTVAELFEVGPDIYTPGSRMPDQRVSDPADRQALVEFLDRASR